VSPVKYELRFYIPEGSVLHNHGREKLKSYTAVTGRSPYRRRNVFPMRFERCFYIPEDGILHNRRRESVESYIALAGWAL
jgi:hypothetical protein